MLERGIEHWTFTPLAWALTTILQLNTIKWGSINPRIRISSRKWHKMSNKRELETEATVNHPWIWNILLIPGEKYPVKQDNHTHNCMYQLHGVVDMTARLGGKNCTKGAEKEREWRLNVESSISNIRSRPCRMAPKCGNHPVQKIGHHSSNHHAMPVKGGFGSFEGRWVVRTKRTWLLVYRKRCT